MAKKKAALRPAKRGSAPKGGKAPSSRKQSSQSSTRPRAGASKGQSRKSVEKVLKSGPLRTPPRAQALPGMENIGAIPELDAHCLALSEIRASMADLRADEQGRMQACLQVMRREKRGLYRQHGMELVRVTGEDKLRVRSSKGGAATADGSDEHADTLAMDADENSGPLGDMVDEDGSELSDDNGVPL